MALHHAFHGIGDDLAGYQRIMHAHVVHGYAVAHADGTHFEGHATRHVDAGFHGFGDFIQIVVTGDDVALGIDHRDKRALHLLVGDAVCLQQAAMRGAGHPNFHRVASQLHTREPPFPSDAVAASEHKKILLQ